MTDSFVDLYEPKEMRTWAQETLGATPTELTAGDYLLGNYVIERKEVSDFFKTLHGGRLENQVLKLLEGDLRPILLVEGEVKDALVWSQVPPSRLLSSYHGMVAKLSTVGICVVNVVDQRGTKQFLTKVAELADNPVEGLEVPVLKAKRLKPDVAALAQIPGVGSSKAKQLRKAFGPIDQLCQVPFYQIEDEMGAKTAEKIWAVLHDRGLPKVYDRLGRGERSRKVVEAAPWIEEGEPISRALAEELIGGWADHLGDLLMDE